TKSSQFRKTAEDYLTRWIVRLLARTPVAPDMITWFGFFLSLGAAALIITEHLFAAGFVVLLAGFFDMLDGGLARSTDRASRFGAVLDSTLDRLAEATLLLSIIVFYARGGFIIGILLAGIALPGSFLVSYIRARAEGMSLKCEVGLFTRAERVIVLALGLLLSRIDYGFLAAALGIIVLFSFITASQRLLHVWQETRKN
ncbi:MAG: CDP-alcohol phosphatidyltransferase family protein, partial [Dehalococcoidales bacterium]|nr:CDP-alcohol phosphatidyltransferase family protein [Dehalococcoidales bacterium]